MESTEDSVNGATQASADSLMKSCNYIRKGKAEKGEAWQRHSEEKRGIAKAWDSEA